MIEPAAQPSTMVQSKSIVVNSLMPPKLCLPVGLGSDGFVPVVTKPVFFFFFKK